MTFILILQTYIQFNRLHTNRPTAFRATNYPPYKHVPEELLLDRCTVGPLNTILVKILFIQPTVEPNNIIMYVRLST